MRRHQYKSPRFSNGSGAECRHGGPFPRASGVVTNPKVGINDWVSAWDLVPVQLLLVAGGGHIVLDVRVSQCAKVRSERPQNPASLHHLHLQ